MLNLLIRKFDVLYTSSEEVRIRCPFCDDTNHHLYINPDKGVGHCFRCEWGGRLVNLAKVLGISWQELHQKKSVRTMQGYDEAISRLRGVANVSERTPVSLPAGYIPFVPQVEPPDMIGRLALSYLKRRGFSADTIIQYALGYGSSGQILGRVIIPVGTNYWQARSIFSNAKQKYLNPKSAKSGTLFNAAALRCDPSFIAEGAFSAISLGHRALAILGKKPTHEQLARLKEADTGTYVLHLDADNEYTYDLAEKLWRAGKKVFVQEYTEGDPNEGIVGEMVHVSGSLFFAKRKLMKKGMMLS